jgi:hypothetical protein
MAFRINDHLLLHPYQVLPCTSGGNRFLVAPSPLALAPIRGTTEVVGGTTEVASTAAEAVTALLIHNGSTGFTLARYTLLGCGIFRSVLAVALSKAGLTSITAI